MGKRKNSAPGAVLVAGGVGIAVALAKMGKLLPILKGLGNALGGAVNSLTGGAQAVGDQVVGGTQAVGDQVVGGTEAVGDQVAGGTEAVGDQVTEGTQAVGDQVTGGTQALRDRATPGEKNGDSTRGSSAQ